MKRILALIAVIIMLTPLCSCMGSKPGYDYSWTDEYRYIAHACGAVDGVYLTNSREALETNYENGCRIFEVDLIETEDGELVCWHGWTDGASDDLLPEEYRDRALSSEEFDNVLIAGKYHTMTFEYLARFMSEHEDVYIVTDTKSPDEQRIADRFGKIVSISREVDETILDRFIPQIYNEQMLQSISGMYHWRSVIYTLYLIPQGTYYEDIINFAADNGIRVITTSEERMYNGFVQDLADRGIYLYMNTINDEEEVRIRTEEGVRGFYTDTLMCS